MAMLRPRDFEDLLARTGLELQVDAERTHLGPHGALDRKGRPVLLFFVPKPPAYDAILARFTRVANVAKRIGAEVAVPEVVHVLDDWLVFVERASGEELCLGDWLMLRPSLARRRQVAERLRLAVSALHGQRLAHGSLSPKHVLVGEGSEVVLTGTSLRALVDDDELDLGIDADALAVAEFLRTLVGSAADDWTDGGFVPPSLAVTGTLTVETPRPVAAESVPREVPAFERLQEKRGNRLAKTLLVVAALGGILLAVVRLRHAEAPSVEVPKRANESAETPLPRVDVAPVAVEGLIVAPLKSAQSAQSVQDASTPDASPSERTVRSMPKREAAGMKPRTRSKDLLEDALSGAAP